MTKQDNNWQSYDGQPLKADEVLIPQLVTEDYARDLGAVMGNLRTWEKSGVYYTVMFVPVKTSQKKQAMKIFNADVNDLLDEKLGPNRFSRCMVPQSDGSKKPCPKASDGNHPDCNHCPMRGKLEKEDRGTVSWSQLDDYGYVGGVEAPVSEMSVQFLLKELIDEFEKENPKLAKIVTLGYSGYSKAEILRMLGAQKSQGYDLWKEAERLTRKFLFG